MKTSILSAEEVYRQFRRRRGGMAQVFSDLPSDQERRRRGRKKRKTRRRKREKEEMKITRIQAPKRKDVGSNSTNNKKKKKCILLP